ncbi:hypothetical protein LXL04_032356 [Taraxacum kok-saghyz]
MLITEDFYIKILDKCPDIKQLKKIHCRLIIDGNLVSASHIALKLMKAYSECRHIAVTRQLFDKSPQKDVVFFNVMIRSYVSNGFYETALRMYRNMLKFSITPDHFTVPQVLKACSMSENLIVGLQTHVAALKKGLHSNLYVGNGLITMYGKCNRLPEGRKVFDEMPSRDVVSWNSIVAAYAQNRMFDDALEVCKTMMQSSSLKPNAGTMASLSPAVTTSTSSTNVKFMNEMFMNHARESLISWNVMIAVYVNNSMPTDAVNLYQQMENYGVSPDSITIASILPACGDLSALLLGRNIHSYIKTKNLLPNLTLENALIDMYAKCGSLNEARKVFDEMPTRDVVTWTSMVSAYGMTGDGQTAITVFSNMQNSGLTPDSISFVPVLSACSHAGLLNQGKHFFRLMTEQYNILPRIEHLACMVDLLGRSGRINEAYEFIKNMKSKPNDRIWGALLSACKVHSNMEIGIIAADHLFQLAPEQAGYYVLLSNIYAKAGRFKDVTVIRSLMKSKGVKKQPGVSNVELNNQVHSFLAGDQSHPQSKQIYEELEVIVGKMREFGYVPEMDSVLHDIEEEDKGNHLVVHSEKLAIVFVIINTDDFTPIRITKNLRVCEDCHIAAKLISKIFEREIILRDTNRFHHFKNGICSCGDYCCFMITLEAKPSQILSVYILQNKGLRLTAIVFEREKNICIVMGISRVIVSLFILLGFNNNIKCCLGEIGTASSYDPPYTPTRCNGNQPDQFPLGNLFVSVSEGLWDNGAACGRRYRLKCLSGNNKPCRGGTIDVKVVDFCSKRPCPSTIVLSNDAFSSISKSQKGKINVEYVE